MKILIAEDDLVSRKMLCKFLSQYGECDITVDGLEALDAFVMAIEENEPYDLICLDIMMPRLDGIKTLSGIRKIEDERNIKEEERCKIIMVTACNDTRCVYESFELGCEAYASKPIDLQKLKEVIIKIGLL